MRRAAESGERKGEETQGKDNKLGNSRGQKHRARDILRIMMDVDENYQVVLNIKGNNKILWNSNIRLWKQRSMSNSSLSLQHFYVFINFTQTNF